MRRRIGHRAFRFVHWFTYAMWPIAVLHGIGNGTNGLDRWFLVLAIGSTVLVGGAVIWRLSAGYLETSGARRASATERKAVR